MADIREDLVHDDRVGELRDESAWAAAMRAAEDVDGEHSAQELGPDRARRARTGGVAGRSRVRARYVLRHGCAGVGEQGLVGRSVVVLSLLLVRQPAPALELAHDAAHRRLVTCKTFRSVSSTAG